MNTTQQILKRPFVTEKSTRLREENCFVVEVHPSASKGDIKIAVEKRFKVDVVAVRTVKIHGKYRRRVGPIGGYQPDRKKAIVRVKAGQQINWEEGA